MLFVLVIAMIGYGAIAGDFAAGLNYLFSWKAEDFSAGTIQAAIGQTHASPMSIGMGTLMAFGSDMPLNQKVSETSAVVVTADTGVALLAGLAIPALHGLGFSPNAGDTLVLRNNDRSIRTARFCTICRPIIWLPFSSGAAFSSMIFILKSVLPI